jgi:cyclin-dependent kinase 8/11
MRELLVRESPATGPAFLRTESGYRLLMEMLSYDPGTRIGAEGALRHPYFNEEPKPSLVYVCYSGTELS